MIPAIAIFDLGRTHKKFLIFDQDYEIVEEITTVIPDIKDGDGDACEDIKAIADWMKKQVNTALQNQNVDIKAINFSAHGASLVHIDSTGKPATPFYDYMKALPSEVTADFYKQFAGRAGFSIATGSPALNLLNSGIQLYWLKKYRPEQYKKIESSLHLPQYGNFIFSGKKHADITSIGCHTGLWDFKKQTYHHWLRDNNLQLLLPQAEPVDAHDQIVINKKRIPVGIGMHDSSAALLPFVKTAKQPFLLLSSGTWNITLNPFFEGSLEKEKYLRDCLYYLLDVERKVAASRLFLGNEYDFQAKRLASQFNRDLAQLEVKPDVELLKGVLENRTKERTFHPETMAGTGPFPELKGKAVDLSLFSSFEEAYHQLMFDLTCLQKESVELICGRVKCLYISGGFVKNKLFMELLQAFFPGWEIFIAENKRASALGAAIALHETWQNDPLPEDISPVVRFEPQLDIDLSRYGVSKFVNK